jgi:hypothetical protein
LLAAARWTRSKLNGFLWGYGERAWILIRNLGVLSLVVFPLLYLALRGQIVSSDGPVGLMDSLVLSFASMLSVSSPSVVPSGTGVQWLVLLEAATGLVAIGLLIALLLKWIVRR